MTRVVDVSNSASFEDVVVMKFLRGFNPQSARTGSGRWGETSRYSFSRRNGAPVRKRLLACE
jgi:hypothetical protein